MNNHHEGHDAPPSFWSSRYAIGLVVIGGVATYFLWTEHRAHLLGLLSYALLLACPLMHVFMHHGPGRHGHHHDAPNDTGTSAPRKPGEPS
jgi:Protein of unknown function (DUF2933)